MLGLSEEMVDREVASSFPSIRRTVLHMWSAESIWLQRLELAENPVWAEDGFKGSFPDACAEWGNTSAAIQAFVARQFDDRTMQHVMQYYTRKREPVKNAVADVLLHMFNHATFHRGQLVTMLRQLGVSQLPATDYIHYLRK